MRVYLISKGRLHAALLGIIVMVLLIAAGWLYMGQGRPVVADPVYQGTSQAQKVALAINVDWGEDVLPEMLQVLKANQASATFFVTGRFAEKFPELVTQMVEDGHEIGNHGYKHPHPDQLSTAQNVRDITRAERILQKLTNTKPVLYAPPYGEHGHTCLEAAEQCGYTTILWTLDTVDWEQPAPSQETLVERATGEKLTSGAILLMHPKAHTVQALPEIMQTLKTKGYDCVSVSDVL